MLPSCVIAKLIEDVKEVSVTVNDGGTLNTLTPCKFLAQDGDLVQFQYIKAAQNDMVYIYHREDIKQIRYEVAE